MSGTIHLRCQKNPDKRLQFKLLEKDVKVFAPGTSQAVLWIKFFWKVTGLFFVAFNGYRWSNATMHATVWQGVFIDIWPITEVN